MKSRQALKLGTASPVKKEKKPIAKMSAKRLIENKKLKKIVDGLKAKDNKCQVKSPECARIGTGSHHIVKRSPKNLLDPENILLCCDPCNGFLERNVEWGRERGFIKSKFSSNKKVA